MSEKLQASELRIGNAVYTVGGFGQPYYVEIIEIRESDVLTDNRKFETYTQAICDVEYPYEDIFGIPLTSEILLACGFEKSKYGATPCEFMHSKYKIGIDTVGDCLIVSWGNVPINEIKYLNHLQNLYYFLCNQELEFKTELK
jgi:hypothetical protein